MHICKQKEICIKCRYLPETEVDKIRSVLHKTYEGNYKAIRMDCFSKEEVDAIKSLLSDKEKEKVIFTWLNFK